MISDMNAEQGSGIFTPEPNELPHGASENKASDESPFSENPTTTIELDFSDEGRKHLVFESTDGSSAVWTLDFPTITPEISPELEYINRQGDVLVGLDVQHIPAETLPEPDTTSQPDQKDGRVKQTAAKVVALTAPALITLLAACSGGEENEKPQPITPVQRDYVPQAGRDGTTPQEASENTPRPTKTPEPTATEKPFNMDEDFYNLDFKVVTGDVSLGIVKEVRERTECPDPTSGEMVPCPPIREIYFNTEAYPDAEEQFQNAINFGYYHAWVNQNLAERQSVTYDEFLTRMEERDETLTIHAEGFTDTSYIPESDGITFEPWNETKIVLVDHPGSIHSNTQVSYSFRTAEIDGEKRNIIEIYDAGLPHEDPNIEEQRKLSTFTLRLVRAFMALGERDTMERGFIDLNRQDSKFDAFVVPSFMPKYTEENGYDLTGLVATR